MIKFKCLGFIQQRFGVHQLRMCSLVTTSISIMTLYKMDYCLTHLLIPVVLRILASQPLGGWHIGGSTSSSPIHPSRNEPWTSTICDSGLKSNLVSPLHPWRKDPGTSVSCDRGLKKKKTYTAEWLSSIPRLGRVAFLNRGFCSFLFYFTTHCTLVY